MMYIMHRRNNGTEVQYGWHVGEPHPLRGMQYHAMISGVYEVQADGDELAFIIRKFSNLPNVNAFVVNWYGDHAKFIVGNLLRK